MTAATITDIEFLKLSKLSQQNHLYLYRTNSALLRADFRAKIVKAAELDGRVLKDVVIYSEEDLIPAAALSADEGSETLSPANSSDTSKEAREIEFLPSLYATITEMSLFDGTLTVRDLGDRTLKQPSIDDLERALDLIARDAAEQSLCLLVPETHEVIGKSAWHAAVEAIGLIEEPMVSMQNYLEVARSYFPRSRLGDLSYLSDHHRFLARLRKFVEQGQCTPFQLSLQIDLIVLGEMAGGEFCKVVEVETTRTSRLVLPETLRRFLDNRDAQSFSALMRIVDGLRHDRMLDPEELLVRLYRATSATLQSRDKRYKRADDPLHCVWAALLLNSERSFLRGSAFVSMDYLCQKYSQHAQIADWFSSDDGWQAIAPLLEIRVTEMPSRLNSARLELQTSLRSRLEVMQRDDIAWFQELAHPSERAASCSPSSHE